MTFFCGMMLVSPGEHGEGVQTRCTGVRAGVTEDGVNVCKSCATAMEIEGFRVDPVYEAPDDLEHLSIFHAGKVTVVLAVTPNDGSAALPCGDYNVTDMKFISGNDKTCVVTFVVVDEAKDWRRRIGVIVTPKREGPDMDPKKTNGKVEIDLDARRVRGTIISEKLSDTGLMKVKLDGGQTVVRHKNRVSPLDDAAKAFLGPKHLDDSATH